VRKIVLFILAVMAVGSLPRLVLAEEVPNCAPTDAGPVSEDAHCNAVGPDRQPTTVLATTAGAPRVSGASSGPAIQYVPYDRLTTGPDGQACVTTGYVEKGVQPTDAVPPDPSSQDLVAAHSNVFAEYPPCPQQPAQPGGPTGAAPAETPAMVAARYWELITLPKPQPAIAPGRAITGKMAYLETRGELTHTYTNATAFGTLVIVAKGSYTIDWGDGETTGPHSVEGKAWPDGNITHGYKDVGSYDVVVRERWIANWSLGGASGVLRTLQTTGRIDDFPVEQIQAVIGR
jgi:hypothetical protein